MPYTQDDVDGLKAAMAARARGERVMDVQTAGGSRVRYADMTQAEMERLLGMMQADVAAAPPAGGVVLRPRARAFRGFVVGGY